MQIKLPGAMLALTAMVLLGNAVGCTTIAKQAFEEARGADGEYFSEQLHPPAWLRPYRSVSFAPATAAIGRNLTPGDALAAYDTAARDVAREEIAEDYPGGEPSLTVQTEFLICQKKGILGSAVCVARTQLISEGRTLSDGIVLVQSKSFRAGDSEALGAETAKALVKYLYENKYTKDERKELEKARKQRDKERRKRDEGRD